MADKNVDKLASLFHDQSKFVHMSGTWKKDEEEVRGSDAVTEFTVTEVYKKQGKDWKLLALTFSSVRDTHKIVH